MKTVDTPWFMVAKFMLFGFGIPLTIVGLVIYFGYDKNLAFLLNGLLWTILGIGLLIKGSYDKRYLEDLKCNGVCYNGTVLNIKPAYWVKIGSYMTATVECTYKTDNGESTISSGYHLFSPMDRLENLHAKIYIDSADKQKYFVEVFRL